MRPKVGRNNPCPCGSGKKFKKCCMGKDQAAMSVPDSNVTGVIYSKGWPGTDNNEANREVIEGGNREEVLTKAMAYARKLGREPVVMDSSNELLEIGLKCPHGRILESMSIWHDDQDGRWSWEETSQLGLDAETCACEPVLT